MNYGGKIGRTAFRAFVWAMAGGIFGGFLTGAIESLQVLIGPGWVAYILATSLAGAVTSSLFGAMQIALMGTMIGVLTAIASLTVMSDLDQPLIILGIAMLAGLVGGRIFPEETTLRSKPLVQAVSGLLGGIAASPVVFLASDAFDLSEHPGSRAALAVALVGILYVLLARWVIKPCSKWVSVRLSGPLVSGIVATSIAAGIWLLGNSIIGGPASPYELNVEQVFAVIPQGVIGGVLGGAIGGTVLEMLGIDVEDYRI